VVGGEADLTCKTAFVNKSQEMQAGRNEKRPNKATNREEWRRVVESAMGGTRQKH